MTETEKKNYYRKRVERDLQGNPNIRYQQGQKIKRLKFPDPDKVTKERMSKLDSYGNPLPGFKWEGNEVVENYDVIASNGKKVIKIKLGTNKQDGFIIDGTEIHRIKTQGIKIKMHGHKSEKGLRVSMKLLEMQKQQQNGNNTRNKRSSNKRVSRKRTKTNRRKSS